MNPNSMCLWFPKIEPLGLAPETRIIPVNSKMFERVMEASEELKFPIFLRTDLSANKHNWTKSCFVEKWDDLFSRVTELYKQMCESNFESGVSAIVLRKFIQLETAFTAFRGQMPINKERRYFINDGKVICHHPYWPPAVFERQQPADTTWRTQLDKLNLEDDSEVELLSGYAREASKVCEGYWSVDFAKAKDGYWYLIDMATGQQSYHWPNCQHHPFL